VFAASLEQAEQLMRAAEVIGPAARPLPLFYALSQAGRAIAAARLPDSAWRLAGHGLSAPPHDGVTDLLRRVVKPKAEPEKALIAGRRSSFAGVADAIGSDHLTGPVHLGAVWAAMPDLMAPVPQIPGLDPAWRRPLRAYPAHWALDANARRKIAYNRPLELLLGGLPVDPNPDTSFDPDALLAEMGEHYPTSAGVAAPGWLKTHPARTLRGPAPTGESLPLFCWPDVRSLATAAELGAIAANYRGRGVRLLVPRIAAKDSLSPLMLWWVLLFGLSSLARYDPELWVAALNVNSSPQAVPIEAALTEALEALPDLILAALTGKRPS